MRKMIIYFLVIFFSIILQISFSFPLGGFLWSADFVLMLVLVWTLLDGFDSFLPWSILAGLLYDLAAFSPVGIHVIIFSLLAYSVSFFSKRFSVEIKGAGILLILFFVLAGTLASHSIFLYLEFGMVAIRSEFLDVKSLLWSLSVIGILNLIIFSGWFSLISWLEKFFYLKKTEKKIIV